MSSRPCPHCGAEVPSLAGYPDWCERCGWNLEAPPRLSFRAGRFAALADTLGRRSGERMARELSRATELHPRWSVARALAYAIAAAVLAFDLLLVAGGVAAIVAEYDNPVSILIGLTMISVGVVMRPRVPRLDTGEALAPERTPALHELVHRVADAEQVRPPDAVVADARWNAAWAVVGLRRRRVLMVGLPLLACLAPQQRVALVAHEVGHERSGDPTRTLVIGAALSALDGLSDILRPPDPAPMQAGLGAVEWLSRGLAWLVSRPVDWLLWLEAILLLRDMQRSEYVADAAAAQVAGTAAVIGLHERLLLHPTFEYAVQRAAVAGDADVLPGVREALQSVPERERERRRRVARLEHVRLTDTHPPTGMRIALLDARGPAPAAVTLDAVASARVDAELEPFEAEAGRALVESYRSSLYYG